MVSNYGGGSYGAPVPPQGVMNALSNSMGYGYNAGGRAPMPPQGVMNALNQNSGYGSGFGGPPMPPQGIMNAMNGNFNDWSQNYGGNSYQNQWNPNYR